MQAGARGGAVGRETVLQTGRSRVRFQILSFEFFVDIRMEKTSWTDHVRNEEVLLRVNEQSNILN